MKVTITIADTAGLGGCSITTTPTLDILSAAVNTVGALSNAGVYALGALNFMRQVSEAGIDTFKIPRPRRPKAIGLVIPVNTVTITLEDNSTTQGVRCTSSPSFATLASMVHGGSKLTQVHKFALVGLSRIYTMAQQSSKQATPSGLILP